MLIDEQETHEVVRQIVFKVTRDRTLHDDLRQEAIIHLWLRETQSPGQTQSWYFQSCRFYLQNYLRLGRSVNSAKHKNSLRPLAEALDCPGTSADDSPGGGSVRSLVNAREAARLLQRWLTHKEQKLLDLLMDGHGIREIAGKLGISHTSVVRYRRRIANLASRLGILPSPGRSPNMR